MKYGLCQISIAFSSTQPNLQQVRECHGENTAGPCACGKCAYATECVSVSKMHNLKTHSGEYSRILLLILSSNSCEVQHLLHVGSHLPLLWSFTSNPDLNRFPQRSRIYGNSCRLVKKSRNTCLNTNLQPPATQPRST